MIAILKDESPMLVALMIGVLAYVFEPQLVDDGQVVALVGAGVLIAAIIGTAMRVANHAEVLAEKVGDPYGTMILTLAAVLVEVIILAIMMKHDHSPTLARDTIYAAVILDINGIIGLAALLGGLKHGEQVYNDNSSRSYGVMILTAVSISMLVPEFIPATRWHLYSLFTIVVMVSMYALFLHMQTGPQSYFFSYNYPEKRKKKPETEEAHSGGNVKRSGALLVVGVVLTGALAEVMSQALGAGLEGLPVPPMVSALVVAIISASPEILTALRAAMANRMQSVINIALGASLSTVILTVPVVEAIALFTGHQIQMAMTPVQSVMMFVTLIVAAINLNDGETNAIEGMTHFVLFATFIMLTVIGL
ncbi:calcium:proton antiporter [Azomonas macrocytogenes]|uniref:Ca2+:H+ antiporter n=1 Tax=Azomonas macrocytogenes TaxID=69962 RepID=A0A839T0J0_AZOMA|nr:calcium:proton antiporter [Azomonas macrocytogenes]MBB3103087.1 Ca2+:H+ antiporter [Azomonas macrocytogenes]